jgi:hypothetical protein
VTPYRRAEPVPEGYPLQGHWRQEHADLELSDDKPTQALFEFLGRVLKK